MLDFILFVTAKCGLAEYTGAEVKVNPKSHFAQYLDVKLFAQPVTLHFYYTSYERTLPWLSLRPLSSKR